MNTILITARVAPLTTTGELVLRPTGGALAGRRTTTVLHRRQTWAGRTERRKAARSASSSEFSKPARDSWGERGLYLALATAALVGVVLAVLNVLEHAQNWPIFNAWVGRILGA